MAAIFLLSGCTDKMNKRVTLWREDKIPYGTWYAYNGLQYFFKDAKIQPSTASPEYFSTEESSSAYIIVGHTVKPSDNEVRALLNHVYAGNKLFISAYDIGANLLDSLSLKVAGADFYMVMDSMTIRTKSADEKDSTSFSYPGFPIETWFTGMDSSFTHVLGTNKNGKPNFVKIDYDGGGQLVIHLAPAAFTNFFLLHKQNKRYYDLAMSVIPDTVSHVRWDDYFRNHINGADNSKRSRLSELLKNPALRWAFWLTVLLFAFMYVFESRRRQRLIPVVPRLSNTSLDFVKTVGQLYYQRRDNRNLALKMTTHFLAHIRNSYNLPTSDLSAVFVGKLTVKTGKPREEINELVYLIKQIEDQPSLSDEELIAFNAKLDKFYGRKYH